MQPVESKAGISVGYRSEVGPLVFTCTDFNLVCCNHCHENNHIIVVYPWSVFSRGLQRMPDLGLGLRAEICCTLFHHVRDLPREWWIRHYAKKRGWSEEEGEKLAKATPETYFKVWNEIASKGDSTPRKAGPKKVNHPKRAKGCPDCGEDWDDIICDNCGYEG